MSEEALNQGSADHRDAARAGNVVRRKQPAMKQLHTNRPEVTVAHRIHQSRPMFVVRLAENGYIIGAWSAHRRESKRNGLLRDARKRGNAREGLIEEGALTRD